jgi:hypothetical protein
MKFIDFSLPHFRPVIEEHFHSIKQGRGKKPLRVNYWEFYFYAFRQLIKVFEPDEEIALSKGICLPHGKGETPNDAVIDFINQIRGKVLVEYYDTSENYSEHCKWMGKLEVTQIHHVPEDLELSTTT